MLNEHNNMIIYLITLVSMRNILIRNQITEFFISR